MSRIQSFGALEGTVEPEPVPRCQGSTFTLTDTLLGCAVTCHVRPEHAQVLREVWGQRVRVTGLLGREAGTGRALDIRDIWRIQILPEVPPGTYTIGLGLLASAEATPPEALVRRMRDAE